MNLELNEAERDYLIQKLTSLLEVTRLEIRHTSSREYRDHLKGEMALIRRLVDRANLATEEPALM